MIALLFFVFPVLVFVSYFVYVCVSFLFLFLFGSVFTFCLGFWLAGHLFVCLFLIVVVAICMFLCSLIVLVFF